MRKIRSSSCTRIFEVKSRVILKNLVAIWSDHWPTMQSGYWRMLSTKHWPSKICLCSSISILVCFDSYNVLFFEKKRFGSLTNFNLSNHRISDYIKNTMRTTDFEGISGRVRFNDQGDRISDVTYEQLQSIKSWIDSSADLLIA